ncbi:MAG: hypothetical protein ACRDSR_09775 [Pseudonocardiaceae bacterium]
MTDEASSYVRDGYVYVPSLISSVESRVIASELALISELSWDEATEVINGKARPFYRHGGVATNPKLWPLLVHPRLVDAVAAVLTAPPHCLPGIDTIGMHASELEPHRDSSPGELPVTAQNPDAAWFPVVRVILYPASPGAEFGLLPGSHRRPGAVRDVLDGAHCWRWQTLRGSDALLFDPRVIHVGTPVSGPKPLVILTFGADGPHALQTYFHARIKTRRLGFPDPPTDLVTLLNDHGLLLPGILDAENWRFFSAVWPDEEQLSNS